jgi:hypothetical protein
MSFHHLIATHSSLPFFRSHGGHLLYAKSTDMKLTQMRRQANCLGLEFGKDCSFSDRLNQLSVLVCERLGNGQCNISGFLITSCQFIGLILT